MSEDFGALAWTDVRERLAGEPAPVVFLVLGAVEAHGPHLPLDTDTVIGLHLAHEAARRLERDAGVPGLVAPPFTATAASCAAAFPGTVHVAREAEAAALALTVRALVRGGARRIALVTLHFDPEHRAAVREAVDALNEDERACVAFPDFTRRAHAQAIGGEFATGDCHGGSFETSLMLAAAPERVGSAFKDLPERNVGLVAAMRAGKATFAEVGMTDAYCGAPARATAEEGHRLFGVLAGIVVGACAEAWGLSRTSSAPR